MKNRLSTLGKSASCMLLLLAACGVTSSCKDDYRLDDEKPGFLNSSILENLQKQNYTYYLRLLNDADANPLNEPNALATTLALTGSKTLFVADDAAWEAFFKKNAELPESNPWHTATSYENLSTAQKKLLIHTSMLNNAIVMENLASNLVDGSMARGEFMRRYTDVETTDSITYLDGNSLPTNYNIGNEEKDYWWRFRAENGGKGIYLVNDSSQSMMVHFTNEHLKKNNVTDEDFRIFMNEERQTEDVHIYDAKLVDKDGVCENGYVNTTSKVITPLPNMAELLRTNGETNIFSHMLDRWSVPFYNRGVTQQYKEIMLSRGIIFEDSIFTKRYFSDKSWGGGPLKNDPSGNQFRDAQSTDVNLKFDPGWNTYAREGSGPEYDMAAMYVPNDTTLWKYFTEGGGGWQLIQTYYMHAGEEDAMGNSLEIPYTRPTTLQELYEQIDQIPISTLNSLLNIIMFQSFVNSVPSKMTNLRDDAQEQIFYADDINNIKKGLLANNGIIYITDKVYGPANYTSVAAPAYISGTNLVMRWAIYNGSTTATDYMGLNYYAYLKAMQSQFAFFLPCDKGMAYYYDPVSFTSKKPRVLKMTYKNGSFPINADVFNYTPENASIGAIYNTQKLPSDEICNRLKDILESHTLVLDKLDSIETDIDEYYLMKNYSTVKVTRGLGPDGRLRIMKVQGGYQLENEDQGIEGQIEATNKGVYTEVKGVQENEVIDIHKMSNGHTYILDSPIIPASKSVYCNLTNNGQYDSPYYSNFYNYCCLTNESIIEKCGLVDAKLTNTQKKAEIKKFQIFVNNNDAPDYNIQFFNNYHYTLFVPTDEAMDAAVQNGLPTWQDIEEDYESCEKDEYENLVLTEDSLRLQAKITYLTNFVRYHFADNSVFADQSKIEETDYVTSSYDNQKGLFCKVYVKRDKGVLEVKDCSGGNWAKIDGKYNVMARDIVCSSSPRDKTSMNGIKISGSSFAVIHQIPTVLNHTEMQGGRYDSTWASSSAAKKYLKRYAIPTDK
ncbi:MAG: fasciclin domain-containing protein [Bacteroidaceae bacterium]|nr:fasciclin domain-containing protein [Bacteroidaceae bacterium]